MDRDEHHICTCRELDRDDYEAECDRRLHAFINGDYAERDEDYE